MHSKQPSGKSSRALTPLPEQPFDPYLLKNSALYRRSRKLFLDGGGTFQARMLSSARALGSASLLKNEIEYSPVASEIEWSLNDRLQKRDHAHLAEIHRWITGVYHEQNHRILWRVLQQAGHYCPQTRSAAGRYLNLTESLVILLDMALADSLAARTAERLYHSRGIYNSGSPFMRTLKLGSRAYRNALQVCLHTTYLRLEGLHPEDIPIAVHQVFSPLPKKLIDQCIERAMRIEPRFVELTNPIWQKKHLPAVMKAFAPPRGKKEFILPAKKPLHHVEAYVIAENWFDRFSL